MKIIILTAGVGTRLRPHTLTRPKALLNVAGRPVLSFILDNLIATNLDIKTEYIFVNGWLGEQIVKYVNREYVQTHKIEAQFVVQPQPLGQAHAIKLAQAAVLKDADDSDLLIVFADTLSSGDFSVLQQLPTQADGALFLQEVPDPRRFGVAVIDSQSGFITSVIEKPSQPISNMAICSPYYFKSARQLFAAIDQIIQSGRQTNGEYFLADAMSQMLENGGRLWPLPLPIWLDAGTFDALLDTNRALLEMNQTSTIPSRPLNSTVTLLEPVWIDTDVIIERSVIGPHVSIGKGAVIRDSVVADSIIEENSQVDGASLRRAIVGRFAKINGLYAATTLNLGDYSQI